MDTFKRMITIVSEIGWNHMGDMDLAKEMIVNSAESGADVCKFQTWSEERLKPGPWDEDGRRDIYKKAQLTPDQHYLLKQACDDNGVQFLTSVFNINDLDFLEELGIPMIKIPGHEVYNLELIGKAAEIFDVVLVSTGAARWNEVKQIADLVDLDKLVLMHCVSTYPCPIENVNLPRMAELKKFNNIVGYSGHYPGVDDAIAAICHGANVVEKHFTINQELPGRDNKFAVLPGQMKVLADFRDNYENMVIDRGLDLQESEMDTFNNYRGRWSKN